MIWRQHIHKVVLRLPDSCMVGLEFGNVGFRGEGKTEVPSEKPLGAKEITNNELNPQISLLCHLLVPRSNDD